MKRPLLEIHSRAGSPFSTRASPLTIGIHCARALAPHGYTSFWISFVDGRVSPLWAEVGFNCDRLGEVATIYGLVGTTQKEKKH